MAHPDIVEAAVVGIPDEKWQERPLASVVLRGATLTPEELRDLRPRTSPVAAARRVLLPRRVRTSVGKFDKKVIRRWYADGDSPCGPATMAEVSQPDAVPAGTWSQSSGPEVSGSVAGVRPWGYDVLPGRSVDVTATSWQRCREAPVPGDRRRDRRQAATAAITAMATALGVACSTSAPVPSGSRTR